MYYKKEIRKIKETKFMDCKNEIWKIKEKIWEILRYKCREVCDF